MYVVFNYRSTGCHKHFQVSTDSSNSFFNFTEFHVFKLYLPISLIQPFTSGTYALIKILVE